MGLNESITELTDELSQLHEGLREDRGAAQHEMSRHGFAVADRDTPLDMVKKLIGRNQHQESLMAALRERATQGERECDRWREEIHTAHDILEQNGYDYADKSIIGHAVMQLCVRAKAATDGEVEAHRLRERLKVAAEFSGTVIETDTTYGAGCVFWAHGKCAARGPIRDPNIRCKRDPGTPHFPREYPIPECRLDEAPILVRAHNCANSGAEQTCGSEGYRGREATTAPCPGGDRSKDPERPR